MTITNSPLNIAFFIEGMSASGVDTSTCLLAKELRKDGHRVTRFLPWKDESNLDDGDEVVQLPSLRVSRSQEVYWTYPLNLPLFEKFYRERFDLIHIHTNTVINLLAWQIAGAFKLPIVYTYHTMAKDYAHYLGPIHDHMGKIVYSAIESYDRLICDRADAIITPSAKAANYLQEIGIDDVSIIPNGINLELFQPTFSNWLHQRFHIPSTDKILLFVGRLNQEKRPLLAYDCFRTLAKQQHNLHLVMVGDGALREELQQRAEEDGLTNQFHLTGLVNYSDMPAIYNSADIWLSTSNSEVHPMVAIEASACGLPSVCWQDEALRGVIEDKVNGFIVDSGRKFSESLQQLLSNDALYQQMHLHAVEKASRFKVENTAQQTLAIYRQVMNDNRHNKKQISIRLPNSLQQWQHKLENTLRDFGRPRYAA